MRNLVLKIYITAKENRLFSRNSSPEKSLTRIFTIHNYAGHGNHIFFSVFFFVLYTYIFYPLILWLLPPIKKTNSNQQVTPPGLTVIIPAYNEAAVLAQKIDNTRQQEHHPLQIIVVTDGSTDNSEQLARMYTDVLFLHEPERRGKAAAINRAVPYAQYDIIVFTDANTFLNAGALAQMHQHFNDAAIGAVCGEKRIEGYNAESIYWEYESVLKKLESRTGSVVGAAGELLAIRKSLFRSIPETAILDDFYLSVKVIQEGFRLHYEPGARATELPPANLRNDFARRTRVAAGVWQWMGRFFSFQTLWRKPFFGWQFFSHRLCRWFIAPVGMLLMWGSSIWLAVVGGAVVYQFVAGAGLLICLLALVGWRSRWTLFSIPFYFIFMHVCLLWGYIGYVRGRHSVLWKKPQR